MKRALWTLGGIAAGLALAALALAAALRPPRLAVPERRDWVFPDVMLVEPGREPRPGSTLRIADGRIAALDGPGREDAREGRPSPRLRPPIWPVCS